MANIYDVASAIQQPNPVGSFQQGIQTARNNAMQNIALQQAQQQMADTQTIRGLAPQIVAGDPNAYVQAAALNPDQANAYQNAGNTQLARLRGALNYLDQQQTPEAKEAIFQNTVRPFLTPLAAANGHQIPETLAEAQPGIDALRAKIAEVPATFLQQGMTADQKNRADLYASLTPEQRAQANRIRVGLDPRATNPNYSVINVPDGQGGTIQAFLNRRTGQVEQPDYSPLGSSNAAAGLTTPSGLPIANDNMAPYIAEANRRVQAGQDPDQVQAWLQTMAQQQQPSAGATAGGLGYAPPKGNVSTLSPDEVKALGLPVGTVAQRGANGKVDVVYKPGAGDIETPIPGDASKSGADYLASLDPALQGQVKAIAEGRAPFPQGNFARSQRGQQIVSALYQYDPGANAQDYNTRLATRKSFTSGKDADNMMALNQVSAHLESLLDALPGTSGIAIPYVGKYINQASNAANDVNTGAVTQWKQAADAVSHEARKVFAGSSGGTLAELDKIADNFNADNSTAQKLGAIKQLGELLQSRIGFLADKYQKGMGNAENPFETTYPHAAQVLEAISNGNIQKGIDSFRVPQGAPARNVPAASAQNQNGSPQDFSHLWGG